MAQEKYYLYQEKIENEDSEGSNFLLLIKSNIFSWTVKVRELYSKIQGALICQHLKKIRKDSENLEKKIQITPETKERIDNLQENLEELIENLNDSLELSEEFIDQVCNFLILNLEKCGFSGMLNGMNLINKEYRQGFIQTFWLGGYIFKKFRKCKKN